MSVNNPELTSPSMLEQGNKILAKTQARAINKELTRLKRISQRPTRPAPVTPMAAVPAGSVPLEMDNTGHFIVVPAGAILAETIEVAHAEAEKTCSDSGIDLAETKKRKKWFKWG